MSSSIGKKNARLIVDSERQFKSESSIILSLREKIYENNKGFTERRMYTLYILNECDS